MKESLSFSEVVVRKCPINKLLITFCQSSLATLIKETPTKVYFCEFSKILKKSYLVEHLQMAGS